MNEPLWIDSDAALAAAISALPEGDLALDTEADSFHHYREKVCLVQIVIDPLAGISLEPLRATLADRGRRKILHGADYDVRILHRDFAFEIGNLFDTMIAARLTGETAFGLAALAEKHLGVVLDKAHQRADWSRRPLTPAMIAYAAADTRHLHALAGRLAERLEALGRTAWAREEFGRVEELRWRAADTSGESWRRVKGAVSLDRRGLAAARLLWHWRDGQARLKDRPPFMVLRDETLVAIARRRPANRSELEGIAGVFPGLVKSPSADAILAAVAAAGALGEGELPEPIDNRRPRLDPAFEARVAEMRKSRDAICKELELDPSVVASRSVLEAIVKARDAGEDPVVAADLRAWQSDLLRPVL
jgi:ribonuclease D